MVYIWKVENKNICDGVKSTYVYVPYITFSERTILKEVSRKKSFNWGSTKSGETY